MKIAWFTPFHRKSAIGKFSQVVTRELARTEQVDIWTADEQNLHDSSLRVVSFAGLGTHVGFLKEYDLVVYNLGDHYPNHGRIYETALQYPGVVILHDFVMHHCLIGYYLEKELFQEYSDAMRRWYGVNVPVTERGWGGPLSRVWERDAEVVRYPLFEETLRGANGVVVHSGFLRERVERATSLPIAKIDLAWEVKRTPATRSRRSLGIPENRALAVSVGHLNENKRSEVMLRVLASHPDFARSVSYVFVGASDTAFGQRMQALCRELDLEQTVRFTGQVDDDVLNDWLTHADFCVNLRWPAMEGGSASCALQMLFGKASIVTDTGVYSELPDDCVLKVGPDHEFEDLRNHLWVLIRDPQRRQRMGEAAARFANANFSPETYARKFLEFADDLATYAPAYRLSDMVAAELLQMGVTPEMAVIETVSRKAAQIMDGNNHAPVPRESL